MPAKKSNKKTLIFLYYFAWTIGIIALGLLIFGIIRALIL